MDPCIICLETEKTSEYRFTCECRAWMHETCTEKWKTTSSASCPICRNPTGIKGIYTPFETTPPSPNAVPNKKRVWYAIGYIGTLILIGVIICCAMIL